MFSTKQKTIQILISSLSRITQILRAVGCTVKTTNLGKRKEVTDTDNPENLTPTVTATLTLPRSEDAPPSPARKRKIEEPGTLEVPIKKEAFLNHPDTEEELVPTMVNIKQEPRL